MAKVTNSSHFLQQRLVLLNERYDDAIKKDRYFYHPVLKNQNGSRVEVDGRNMLMFCSYSYLGLIGHPTITEAVQQATQEFGSGTHGVRLLAGTTQLHEKLEERIAKFKGTQDAVVFSSGYITNIAAITTLVNKEHVVICDKLNHASIIDGCKLSGARLVTFKHEDMADLERRLQQFDNVGKLVVVDAVFSMDGDIANLPHISKLCRRYNAALMVDEAHSLGTLGATGHGIEEHFSMKNDTIDIKMGTLSKTIPALGGYIAGSTELCSALRHNARPYIFSAALPPANVAAALAAFDVIENEPQLVRKLHANVDYFLKGAEKRGLDTLLSETAIAPIICKSDEEAFEITRLCFAQNLLVMPIVFPAVPKQLPRIRMIVSAVHSTSDIDTSLDILAENILS